MPPRKRNRLNPVDNTDLNLTEEAESAHHSLSSPRGGKAFHCHFCTRAFHRKEHLQRHERLHTKERPFQCTFCSAGFARRDLLARHTRITHENEVLPSHCDNEIDRAGHHNNPSLFGATEGPDSASPPRVEVTPSEAELLPFSAIPALIRSETPRRTSAMPPFISPDTTLNMVSTQETNNFSDFDVFLDSINGTYDDGPSSFYVDQPFFPPPPSPLFPTIGSQPRQQNSGTDPSLSNAVSASEPRLFDEFTSTLPSFEPSHAKKARREPHKITQQDWDYLSTEVKKLISIIPKEFFLPSRHTMTRYITTYFAGFHRHLPFIHYPTFSGAKYPVELILSMATIGAISAFDSNNAIMLFRTALVICQERLRQRKEQRRNMTFQAKTAAPARLRQTGSMNNTSLPTETTQSELSPRGEQTCQSDFLPLVQALLILMAMATWGNSEAIFDEAVGIQNILVNYMRSENLLEPRTSGSSKWDIWIQEEGFKRTVAITFCFFNFHTIVYDIPPPLLNSELNIQLPSREKDWEAETEEEWQQARSKHEAEPDFQSFFASLFLPQTERNQGHCSSLGGYMLIIALIQHIYFLRRVEKRKSEEYRMITLADMTEVDQALKNWQTWWNQDPESFLGPGSPLGPISFNSTALLRMAFIRLNVDLGPWRALKTHIPHEIAMSIHLSPPLATNRRLTRAVLYSAHALSIPIKIGINIVAHNQAFSWSLQHSLCALECAYIISKWLIAIQPHVSAGTIDEEEARLYAYIVDMVTEAEAGGGMKSTSTKLCARVVRIWAAVLSGKAHWNVVRMIGSILEVLVVESQFQYLPPSMSLQSPIHAAPHVQQLLSKLHQISLEQEAGISGKERVFSSDILGDLEDKQPNNCPKDDFDRLMLDKFIALDEDKCQFTYQLVSAMGATNIVEAGTSFGVSTIYLALAVANTKAATGKPGIVIATEKEPQKAAIARKYWAQCGPEVEQEIELREGDLLETLKDGLPEIDLLLLDIWSALSLPTLKTVLPCLRPGAVVLTDNTISGAKGYTELLAYLRAPENGFQNMTLPFTNGFEMSVYRPNERR
ncbi:hypothetical protein BJX66DRAFT_329703 [Aspergillus keveii]|uniref:C2H2-type domain-containing protein n=1 Tax=Aspergillus keveii TaxID=714993 RepID=A0ABR4FNK1_9EURO